MNKREAIQAMLDGKKVTREDFSSNEYFTMDTEGNTFDVYGNKQDFNFFEMNPSGWGIYQEPKKLVKFYQYLASCGNKIKWFYSDDFQLSYLNHEEGAIKALPPVYTDQWKKIQGAWIEVEV